MTFRHLGHRLSQSLERSSQAFSLKKALLLLGGTLMLAFLAGAEGVKYTGKDNSISELLKNSELQSKMAIGCKLISETSGLLHEFDTLGEFEVAGLGVFSPRSSEERLGDQLRARISLTESNDVGLVSSFSNRKYEIQVQFSGKADFPLKNISGQMIVSEQEESSLVLDLSPQVFLKCVNLKGQPSQEQNLLGSTKEI